HKQTGRSKNVLLRHDPSPENPSINFQVPALQLHTDEDLYIILPPPIFFSPVFAAYHRSVYCSARPDHYSEMYLQTIEMHRLIFPYMSDPVGMRSDEHTSELQSRFDIVCRLLLYKNKILCINVRQHLLSY